MSHLQGMFRDILGDDIRNVGNIVAAFLHSRAVDKTILLLESLDGVLLFVGPFL
jgi:hypothetical protein